ncbi:UNVERIFIED_CONTAM: hypothetical protein HDU68_002498, partial [Siphonaria sp. JEL0065]
STFIKPNSTPLHISLLAHRTPLTLAEAEAALVLTTAPLPTLVANQLHAVKDSLAWDLAANVYSAPVIANKVSKPVATKKSTPSASAKKDKLHKTMGNGVVSSASASDSVKKTKKSMKNKDQ